jgi:hypothetical protein
MTELGAGADIFRFIGGLFWFLVIAAILAAVLVPKSKAGKIVAVTTVLGLFIAFPGRWAWQQKQADDARRAFVTKAKTLYAEKCKTVAGEKIYRTVPDVEGIVLLKVRPQRDDRELADLMWPGAAFADESWGNGYITSFLGSEYALEHPSSKKAETITPENRGRISTANRPGGLPGYRYVDVIDEKDGKRYRVTGSNKAVRKKDTTAPNVQSALINDPNYDLNVYQWTLDKSLASEPSPRYGVTFEDHVIPEERALGLASSTVKVLDLQTNEVLGELTRYIWGSTRLSTTYPTIWLTAVFCPKKKSFDSYASTRQFVDQILIPKREK